MRWLVSIRRAGNTLIRLWVFQCISQEMNVSEQEKKKVAKEEVVCEDDKGTPHVTVDRENRTIHHYADGCPAAQRLREARRMGSGPAKVTNDAFRAGWDGINWGAKTNGKGLPS